MTTTGWKFDLNVKPKQIQYQSLKPFDYGTDFKVLFGLVIANALAWGAFIIVCALR